MAKTPIDMTKVHSAKQLHDLHEAQEQEDKKARHLAKLNVRRKQYGERKITRDFPGVWLFVDQVFPDIRYKPERRLEEANELIHWHRQNGTLDTLKSTYRGDFYTPEKGSPEEQAYWGDFYDNKSYTKVIAQERAIKDLRREYTLAEIAVENAGRGLEDTYKKSKAQQYRWKRRLTQINEETTQIVQRLDMIMPSSMIPIALDWDDPTKFDVEHDRGNTQAPIEAIAHQEIYDQTVQHWEQTIMESHSFAEVQELIRDRDRLTSLNTQKSDILRKMDGWADKQGEIETGLMEDLLVAQTHRDEIRDKLEGLNKTRGTKQEDVKGLMQLRNALVHKSPDLPKLVSMHEKKGTLQFFEGTSIGEMLEEYLAERDKKRKQRKGTLYTGTVTIPPNSTVELDLDDLVAENDAGIQTAKEITLKTDALRNEKLEKQQKQAIRTSINTKTVMNIATMLPTQMLNANKDLPHNAGGTMRHDMQKLEEWDLVGKNSVECLAPPKVMDNRESDHARKAIALRGGIIVPKGIFLIDVLYHWKTNTYLCQIISGEQNKRCALALGFDRSGPNAGKLVARTAFFWRPDIWTQQWEADNCILPPGRPDATLEKLVEEHNRLLTILPMPNQVTDILGITMNDPATNIAFN